MHTQVDIAALLPTTNAKDPIFLGSRVRLARNLAKYPFPQHATREQKREIFRLCADAIMHLDTEGTSVCLRFEDLDEVECLALMESHQVSVDLIKDKEEAGVIINKKRHYAFMLNEEDHLRLQILGGENFKTLWRQLDRIDSLLEENLEYAFQPRLGYLTACPSNLGTGMRVSAMLHLPALVLNNQHVQVCRALMEMGMVLRGVYGEQSKAVGHIFQISNQTSLGSSEAELLDSVEKTVYSLIQKEKESREQLLSNSARKICDLIGRAWGILRSCIEINAEEASNLLSVIILALDLGFIQASERRNLYVLRQRIQPAHLQLFLKKRLSVEALSYERAKLLRAYFSKSSEPNFKIQGKELRHV